MTYPPSGSTPDPYQPQQPYGQPYDPTTPHSQDPYASPSSGAPSNGEPYPPPYGNTDKVQSFSQPYSGAPYGGHPYQQPYAPVVTTNTMAILALVFAFVFAPAAIIFGHIAKKQIRQTGEQGDGLATAGLWLGYIFTGLGAAFCALWVALAAAGIWSSTGY